MEALWMADEPMTVRDVHSSLVTETQLAYTTVMTVLDNLHTKGLTRRTKVGRAFVYEPVASRDAYTASLMREALANGSDTDAVFMHFVSSMDEDDTATLRSVLQRLRRARGRK